MRKYADLDYDNIVVSDCIDRVIHSERDRRMLKLSLCDGVTYEKIAEIENIGVSTVKRAVLRGREKVFRRMKLI